MRKECRITLAATAALSLLYVTDVKADRYPGMDNAEAAATAISPSSPQPQGGKEAKQIEGVIVDKTTGEPLIGATILLKGQSGVGTRTDFDGKFSLSYTPKDDESFLVVSYVGYQPKEVPISGISDVKVELDPATQSLNEVVVTGSGIQKKVSVTGAISTVSGLELKSSTSALTLNLAGKFAGVYANNSSGEPGSGADFYIRGISNFAGKSATPLILLDDVEISASDLNNIPAENIQSFSVLKDASATAIYGARGANGVMIITTKTGDYNTKTKINVNVENSFNFMGKLPDFVDGPTYMEMYNLAEWSRNTQITPRYTEEDIERTRSGINPYLYPNVNWQDVLFKKMAMRQRVNVNVSGGGSKVKYYMAFDFKHEDGHYNTEKRYSWNNQKQNYNYSFQNNISYKLTKSTTVSMNLNAQIQQTTEPNVDSYNFFYNAMNINPVIMSPELPARDGYNHVLYGTYENSNNQFMTNPWADMMTSFRQFNGNTVNAVVKIDQDLAMITKGLKFNAWVNFKNYSASSYSRSITPYRYVPLTRNVEDWQNPIFDLKKATPEGSNYINQSGISRASNSTFELQANINWDRRFGEHEINAVALYRMREYRNDVLPNRNQGFSGRVTYDYGHRYLLEFNFGYNGTERLAKGHRYGFFPAGSIGWVVSGEKFWEPIKPIVSFFKIRGSYGLVGSDNLTPPGTSLYFFYYDQISDNDLNKLPWRPGAGGSLGKGTKLGGPELSYIGLPDLGWEKVKKLDIGVDLRLFNDLNITLDYFYDRRYDILMRRQSWPNSLGYGAAVPYGPVGRVDNRGIEGSITYTKALTQDLSISFNGNFTYNRNKLVDGDELQYKYPWLFSTGLPMNYLRGYIAEGLFQSEDEIKNSPVQSLGSQVMVGDIKYRDLNGDGQITPDDQTMISEYGWTPRLQYGFGATVNWKQWDFGFFFTGSAKRKICVNGIDPFNKQVSSEANNMFQWIYDSHFDPRNPDFNVEYPRMGLNYGEIVNNTVASTHWVRDASFLRLRNLELGYSFKYGRVYVQGNNLLLFTPFKYWDPEMSSWTTYPTQKQVTVGVQFKL